MILRGLVRTSSTLIQKYLNTLRFRFKLFHALSIVYSFSRGDCSYQATIVVMMAPIIGNQSERSKFGLDQSESRISPM